MTAREIQIHERTIDLLIDKGILSTVDMKHVRSFEVLLYQSERLMGLGKDHYRNWKTSAQLLSLELNLTEDEFLSI